MAEKYPGGARKQEAVMIVKKHGVTVDQLKALKDFAVSPGCQFWVAQPRSWGAVRDDYVRPAIQFLNIQFPKPEHVLEETGDPLVSIVIEISEFFWVQMPESDRERKEYIMHYGYRQEKILKSVIDEVCRILGIFPEA